MPTEIVIAILFTTAGLFLLIAGVITVVYFSHRSRVKQREKIERMKVAFEKELRQVEMEIQEHTLNAISYELHDNVGQLLSLTRLQLQQLKPLLPGHEKGEKLIALGDQALHDAIQQVRLLSHSLNTDFMHDQGLKHMLDTEIMRLRQTSKFHIEWDHDGDECELNKEQQLILFRIFQEIMNNAQKHSEASNIQIHWESADPFLFSIADNGNGFNLEETLQKSSGMGLANIKKRCALASIQCRINTAPGMGCTYIFSDKPITS